VSFQGLKGKHHGSDELHRILNLILLLDFQIIVVLSCVYCVIPRGVKEKHHGSDKLYRILDLILLLDFSKHCCDFLCILCHSRGLKENIMEMINYTGY
jgi:hypothetical protein